MHNWPDIIMAVVAVLGVVAAVTTWIYKRGKYEQQLKDELSETRKSVNILTDALNELASGLKDIKAFISTEITDLKVRVTVLEKVQSHS